MASSPLTGAPNFNQWFETVAGVNLAFDETLLFVDNGNGTFTYANNSFFPLDDELLSLGFEGKPHNYWFTFELKPSPIRLRSRTVERSRSRAMTTSSSS